MLESCGYQPSISRLADRYPKNCAKGTNNALLTLESSEKYIEEYFAVRNCSWAKCSNYNTKLMWDQYVIDALCN